MSNFHRQWTKKIELHFTATKIENALFLLFLQAVVCRNKCLRRILRIFWPQTMSNYKLRRRTGTEPITQLDRRKRWKWIGHVLRMPPAALPRVALRWTPDGRRKRGRLKETWRRTVEKEMKENSWTWGHLERRAPNRSQWRTLTEALCVSEHEED